MPSVEATRNRIKSVETTRKITKAMQLVATAKFRKTKQGLAGTQVFYENVYEVVNRLIAMTKDNPIKVFEKSKESNSALWIVINSSLGLCGGFNINVNKMVKAEMTSADKIFAYGSKAVSYWKNHDIVESIAQSKDKVEYSDAAIIGEIAMDLLAKGEISTINIAYTKFINSVTFEPTKIQVWPIDYEQFEQAETFDAVIEFEPDAETVLKQLLPLYVNSMVFGSLSESKVSETASRRNAMEAATKNADELKEKLRLDMNRVRQSSITQEISEIVAGSDA